MYEKIANRLNEIYEFDDHLAVEADEVEDYLRHGTIGDLTDEIIIDIENLLKEYAD